MRGRSPASGPPLESRVGTDTPSGRRRFTGPDRESTQTDVEGFSSGTQTPRPNLSLNRIGNFILSCVGHQLHISRRP